MSPQKPRLGVELIDLKKSVIDEKNSNKEKGVYNFSKRVLFNRNDNPKYVYKWVQTRSENIQKWVYANKAEFVENGDAVYPAPLALDEEGHYKIPGGDLVLMKIPIDVWLAKREIEVDAADKAARGAYRNYEKMTQARTGGKLGNARLTKADKDRLGL